MSASVGPSVHRLSALHAHTAAILDEAEATGQPVFITSDRGPFLARIDSLVGMDDDAIGRTLTNATRTAPTSEVSR